MTVFCVGILLGLGPSLRRVLGVVLLETILFSDLSVLDAFPVREDFVAGLAFSFLWGFVVASVSEVAFVFGFVISRSVSTKW